MSGPMRRNLDETLDALDEAVDSVKRAFKDRRDQESDELRKFGRDLDGKDGELGGDGDIGAIDRPDTSGTANSDRRDIPNRMSPEEYARIREESVHNPDANEAVLGKYYVEGTPSYIDVAKETDSAYFDLGDGWGTIKDQHDLTDQQMFDGFNVPFLDDSISRNREIVLSHDPRDFEQSMFDQEYQYLLEHGYILVEGPPMKMIPGS